MKLSLLTTVFALLLAVAPQAAAQATGTTKKTETRTRTETRTQREMEIEAERQAERLERERDRHEREREESRSETHRQSSTVERTSAAESQAVVTLCLSRGDVIVRGWDKREVHARAAGVGNVRLLTPNVQPAPRVEVLVADEEEVEPDSGDCGTADQIELMVPRGSTVNVRTQNGHVDVSDVSDARVEALSGDVEVRRVAKSVQVSCLSGDVMVTDVSGPIHAATVSGSVEARNTRPLAAGDDFDAKSTSGDVTIENVRHSEVSAATISGSILYTGALARGGAYDFKTISGDVTVEIPSDSSFTLHAKVVVSGDIDTDFPVKTVAVGSLGPAVGIPSPPNAPQPPPVRGKQGKIKPPREPEQTRLDGTVGSGDATVNMSSFSGSLHLRKQ
ncbi:MAG TPA: DUF4097 family beta strand repeat-containing protein [Pyrinomonadaceae bacterium]|jgi:DUF4097 and DUF4098 domain-containing protein YvlB|nr:DUF4097 family beta strand repeat-containing protein [Pyrinomonadaceae bacterium]